MAKKNKDFEGFIKEIFKYYLSALEGISKSVSYLAKIQREYPAEYERFKQVTTRPELLLRESQKLNESEKSLLLEILLKASVLSSKTINLFNLTVTEKESLAKELTNYAKLANKRINLIKKTTKK